MNVVFVGYGDIAGLHARAIQLLREGPGGRDLRLYGVVGRVRQASEAFALEFGMEVATTTLEEVLADPKVDVVVVCSPTELHAEQTERALRAGKHVLCEIPLALSLTQTDALIRVADESRRCLMVCHTQRFYRGLQEARRMVADGELHPSALVGRCIRLRRVNEGRVGRKRSWTDNLLWHHGCHSIDTALWLLGATEVEVAAQVALPSGHLNIPMDLTVTMRTPRDQIATIVMSYNSHFRLHDYLVFGEETSVLWETDQLRGPDRILAGEATSDYLAPAVLRQDAEFFAAVREQREPAVSARTVRPAMVALQAAQDSLEARIRGRRSCGGECQSPSRKSDSHP
jgi:2-hydroxy-4-carboxymuconate semialdehyde hemiacetal dehydrogenase